MTVGTVAEVWRHPVKSMAGERLDEVDVTADGIEGDRRWALRDVDTGKIVSAKRPARWGKLLDFEARTVDGSVEITTPDGERVGIAEPGAATVLSEALGHAVEVVSGAPEGELYASEWPEIDGLVLSGEIDFPIAMDTDAPSFVDLATLHLLTTSSLAALDDWVGESVADVRRFRPSFVIDTGGEAGVVEEDWSGSVLRIGRSLEVRVGDPTPRCVMTTIGQADLERRNDVLQAIAANNRHDVGGFGDFACLGVYAEVVTPGPVSVGDEVHLT